MTGCRVRSLPWTWLISIAMSLALAATTVSGAQTTTSGASPDDRRTTQAATIHGTVRIGTLPLQSVRVTASNTRTGRQVTTITDGNGAYSLALPRGGRFLIRAERFGFATSSTEVLLSNQQQLVNFSLKSGGDNLSSLWEAALLPPVSVSSVSLQPAFSTIGASSGAQIP